MNTDLLSFIFPSGDNAKSLELKSYSQIEKCRNELARIKQSDSLLWYQPTWNSTPVKILEFLNPTHLDTPNQQGIAALHLNAITGNPWPDFLSPSSNFIVATAHGLHTGLDLKNWSDLLKYTHPVQCLIIACFESDLSPRARLKQIFQNGCTWASTKHILQTRPDSTIIHPICQLPLWFSRLLMYKINQNLAHAPGKTFIVWFEDLLKQILKAFTPDCEENFAYTTELFQSKILEWEGVKRKVTLADIFAPYAFAAIGNLNSKCPGFLCTASEILEKLAGSLAEFGHQKPHRVLIGHNGILSQTRPNLSPAIFELPDTSVLVWYPQSMLSANRQKHIDKLLDSQVKISCILVEDTDTIKLRPCHKTSIGRIYGISGNDNSLIESIRDTDIVPEFNYSHFKSFKESNLHLQELHGGFYDEEELVALYLAHELKIYLPRMRHGFQKLLRIFPNFE
ncbi:MAG: hypothetical protein H3C47_06270 [Candidatus Cloacimonetes bacterium]|nr:hypothetical protein [Candidatus Cloacimonadota bacterium]